MFIDRLDEEFLLFALDGDGNLVEPHRKAVESGVAGAWLAEMVMHNRIRLLEDRVVHRSHSTFGEPVMDELLATVWSVRRPRRVKTWVQKLRRQAPRRTTQVLDRLAERGYLEKQGRGRRATYQVQGDGRSLLRAQLLEVLEGRRTPDEATVALIALLDAAGLMGHAFGHAQQTRLHNQAQLLLRGHRSFALIAEGVRGRSGRSWLARQVASVGPRFKVKGKTVKQAQGIMPRPTRFDPHSGGRRPG